MPADAATVPNALDLVLRLRRIPPFREPPLESLHALALSARVERLAPGQPLARAGEPWSGLYLVLDGELEGPGVRDAGNPTERAEFLGALALLSGQPLSCPVVARGPVQLLRVPADALFALLEEDFGALLEVIRSLTQQLLDAPITFGGLPPRAPQRAPPLDLVERMLLMWRSFRLEHVSTTALADLARSASQSVADGTRPLWSTGDAATEMVLVVDGAIELRPPAAPALWAGPQAVLGGYDFFAGAPRRYDTIPTAGTVLLHLPGAQLLGILEDHFDIAVALLAALSRDALQLLCGPAASGG
jgi:Cyclic nucleotide-binding domain